MAGKLAGARIAIVEDDTLLLDSLAMYLRTKQCQVETFGCAEDAASAASPGMYEVVISDYVLPGEDGLSFLRRVHEQASSSGTVLITGHSRTTLLQEAKAAGIDGFLLKPLCAGDLEAALQRILEGGES